MAFVLVGIAGDDQSPASPVLVVFIVSSTTLEFVLLCACGIPSLLQNCTATTEITDCHHLGIHLGSRRDVSIYSSHERLIAARTLA